MRNGEFLRAMSDSDLSSFIAELATDCVSCSEDGQKKMPCLNRHGVLWCDENSVQAWLISEATDLDENKVISFEAYGIVDDREIFCGSSDSETIAYAIANNNLGTARYAKTIIYKIVKENDTVIERSIFQKFEIPNH